MLNVFKVLCKSFSWPTFWYPGAGVGAGTGSGDDDDNDNDIQYPLNPTAVELGQSFRLTLCRIPTNQPMDNERTTFTPQQQQQQQS